MQKRINWEIYDRRNDQIKQICKSKYANVFDVESPRRRFKNETKSDSTWS